MAEKHRRNRFYCDVCRAVLFTTPSGFGCKYCAPRTKCSAWGCKNDFPRAGKRTFCDIHGNKKARARKLKSDNLYC